MPRLPGQPPPVDTLAVAKSYDALGLNVFPAKYRDKMTVVDWKKHQTVRTTGMLESWFRNGRLVNFWVMCGQMSKVIVIDCDSEAGDKWWRAQLGDDIMDNTAIVKTSKGRHYWFRIPDEYDRPVQSWSVHPNRERGDAFAESFDVRADRTGVIVPPSVHETGFIYQWERDLDMALYAPASLLSGALRETAPRSSVTTGPHTAPDYAGATRSLLVRLLENPPGEGGRNEWLTRVAGHYAKQFHNQRDIYNQLLADANVKLLPPLQETEFHKLANSVWKAEHETNERRAVDGDCGWLKGNGKRLFTQVQVTSGDTREYDLAEYGNFDIEARGATQMLDGTWTYWVTIQTPTGVVDTLLRASTCGDDRKFRSWLASFRCQVVTPYNIFPREMSPGIRVQRYLDSQNPPSISIAESLGWEQSLLEGAGAYVTHEGLITAAGRMPADRSGVRTDPVLLSSGFAPHQYGFERDADEARRVLEEVLTFHDESVCSTFGAWWAACLLKPQILANSALFPFMAIQAPSESGKTNGFFDMMVQLNGNTRGETVPTYAALRSMVSAHNNGIVWVDDLDDPSQLMELLRAATSGGTISKMGEDRASTVNQVMRAPIVLSGEQLGMNTQKALIDRAISLSVRSPTGRMSRHNPSRPQWDDVLRLRRQYPQGLSVLAGWYVQEALVVAERVLSSVGGLRGGRGRAGDKVAVLRAGARLLDHLCGHGGAWDGHGLHATRVESWLSGHAGQSLGTSDNALTLELMPWALRSYNFPDHPEVGENGRTHTPVWVHGWAGRDTLWDEVTVWVNTDLLAEAWERAKHGRIEKRTQTAGALRDQLDSLQTVASRQFRLRGSSGSHPRLRYMGLVGESARSVILRAQGPR